MRRTGIDLSSTRCVIVDVETSSRWRKHGETASLRVHNFAVLNNTDSAQALTAELKALIDRKAFPRRAWVNLWEVRSSHQYLLLPSAKSAELESMARHHGASVLGIADAEVTVATSIGSSRGEPGHHQKTELSFFAASSQDVRQRLRPILEAGLIVEGVTTPCGALWSQSRLRRPALPGEVHAFVALGPSMSALAIFSNGFLLYAKDLDWGYAAVSIGVPEPLDREELAERLATELLRSFLYLRQYWDEAVSQVLLCGDMPEIRSLTAPLIERLNIEVETLDTLDGIDTTSLPDGFAERAATFRLASSIAVEPPQANLLPPQITAQRASRIGLRIFAAGSAAAVAAGAFLYADASVGLHEAERQSALVRQELSALQPRLTALDAANSGSALESRQRAALESLDAQGPRMARVLQALAEAVPAEVTLKSVRAVPNGAAWGISIEAFAAGADAGAAWVIADGFLQALQRSPVFGAPLRVPSRRTIEGAGVELVADYSVPR